MYEIERKIETNHCLLYLHVVYRERIYNYLENLLECSPLFQLSIYVRQDFLHKFQPKKRITIDLMRKQI